MRVLYRIYFLPTLFKVGKLPFIMIHKEKNRDHISDRGEITFNLESVTWQPVVPKFSAPEFPGVAAESDLSCNTSSKTRTPHWCKDLDVPREPRARRHP